MNPVHHPDLAVVVCDLLAAGSLSYGVEYGKSDLLSIFESHATEVSAGRLFVQLRRAIDHGRLTARLHVRTSGSRNRMKYIFTDRSASPPPPMASPPPITPDGRIQILAGDNLPHLRSMDAERFRLIYVDPPFNTGKRQTRTRIRTIRDDEHGDRTGFKGQRYRTVQQGTKTFGDTFDDYLGFLTPRLEQAHRLLTPDGSLFVHLDYREVHYAKVLLDEIFGRDSFINEIIWAYDYGARSKKAWSSKHDNILWYAKDPSNYVFNFDEMDRIPYMAPGLVGPEKAARGKTPTDVWWHTIVSPGGREKTGYPTQKPLGVLRRIVKVHSTPGDRLLDFFAGSGSFGEAGAALGRSVTLIDRNEEALEVMHQRLARFLVEPPNDTRPS